MFRYEVVEQRPIIYVDESGFALDSPRDKGYSTKGEKCYGYRDWHAKDRTNAIGAIMDFKLLNVCLFDSNIDADIFYAWVTQELLTCTPDNAVVVLDNATFHKRNDIVAAIEKQELIVQFLPPYSPDLNPIEKKWAQAKSIRRKFNYTPDELFCSDLI